MEKDVFLAQVAATACCDANTVASVYGAMVEVLSSTLGNGEGVDLTPEFANFKVKLRDNPGLDANSPRTPKRSHYTVCFRAGSQLEKKLKI